MKKSGVITRELVSQLYNVPTQTIITFGFFDLVNAVKITLPRPRAQGGIGETDMHAAQQHVPLQEIRVPWPAPIMIGRRTLLRRRALVAVAGRVAAAWPARPIKLVAPFAPGGGSDFTSRLVAEKMTRAARPDHDRREQAGRRRQSRRRGRDQVAADGYTYLTISGSYAINSILHKPSFDSLDDIVAIGQFTDEPTVLPSTPRCRPGRSGAGRALPGASPASSPTARADRAG